MENQDLDLVKLGERLGLVDMGILAFLARRNELALLVEEVKHITGDPITRLAVEDDRLQKRGEWAARFGLNPHFVESVFYQVIGESNKAQMMQLQARAGLNDEKPETQEQRDKRLRENLLELTKNWASVYDNRYAQGFFATTLHREFEDAQISGLAKEGANGLAIDLGCATGTHAALLAPHFERVVGYDISPDMIRVAEEKNNAPNVEFHVQDLQKGIPLLDESVSLAIVSMGTASDIPSAELLREVQRVLKKGGKAFLSFYNKSALIYEWGFIPWLVGLVAIFNPNKDCLDVLWEDEKGIEHVYSVFAEPHAPEEVEDELLPRGLFLVESTTHPTFACMLPSFFLEREEIRLSIADMDSRLAQEGDEKGAYLTVVARKS